MTNEDGIPTVSILGLDDFLRDHPNTKVFRIAERGYFHRYEGGDLKPVSIPKVPGINRVSDYEKYEGNYDR